ncbi:MAG: copper chaperone PCu(A)C [Mariprofundales bacterium]
MRKYTNKITMFPVILLVMIVCFITLSSTANASNISIEEANRLVITQAYVRAMPPGLDITAAYMTIYNPSKQPITIIELQSPRAKKVEMHENISHNGMTHMQRINSIIIPQNGEISFSSGGKHLMLMGINETLKSGQKIQLTLILQRHNDSNTYSQTITVEVQDMRNQAPHHQHH